VAHLLGGHPLLSVAVAICVAALFGVALDALARRRAASRLTAKSPGQ
jgi:hypothetical protein